MTNMSCVGASQCVSSFPAQGHYQCQTIALRLQESLCIVESQCSLRNMGYVLRTNKRILVQCSSLLNCTLCSTMSHFMMLLTTICQRITSCFERVLVILVQQYNYLQNRRARQPCFGSSEGDNDEESHQMTVHGYDLDIDEEPCLFGALALVGIHKLRIILGHIREITTAQRWDPHTTIIDRIANDVSKQIGLYDKTRSIDKLNPNL